MIFLSLAALKDMIRSIFPAMSLRELTIKRTYHQNMFLLIVQVAANIRFCIDF